MPNRTSRKQGSGRRNKDDSWVVPPRRHRRSVRRSEKREVRKNTRDF